MNGKDTIDYDCLECSTTNIILSNLMEWIQVNKKETIINCKPAIIIDYNNIMFFLETWLENSKG